MWIAENMIYTASFLVNHNIRAAGWNMLFCYDKNVMILFGLLLTNCLDFTSWPSPKPFSQLLHIRVVFDPKYNICVMLFINLAQGPDFPFINAMLWVIIENLPGQKWQSVGDLMLLALHCFYYHPLELVTFLWNCNFLMLKGTAKTSN